MNKYVTCLFHSTLCQKVQSLNAFQIVVSGPLMVLYVLGGPAANYKIGSEIQPK